MRNFDIAGQFEAVKKSATDALNEIFPVQGKLRVLTADRVWVEDTADSKDYSAQASIKSKDGTWGVPVYASMTLKDRATGKVIDRAPKVKMFNLPKITDRFSYIVNGNEYQVTNQLRLKPGAYTLRKQNGELKTQVNLAKGRNFDMAFDEGNGTFSILKVGGGQANVPLYPLLQHLGMSSQAMAGAWGPKIEEANRHYDPKALSRIESAFGQREGGLKTYFATTEISPEVTKTLLGKSFSRVDGPMLLASSKKLLDVHLGHQKADDRDSLEFKDLLSTEDFIHERIQKNKYALTHKVNRNIDNPRRDKITQIVNPGSFTAAVEGFFTQDDKSATPEQTNPIEMVAGMYRATIMGAGGIKSDQSITPAMREIHPSQYGFIDPIHSPEGNVGVNLNLPMGVVKDGGTLKATVLDKNKKPVTLSPAESFSHVVAFPNQTGPIYKALLRGKVVDVTVDKVDYYTPTHKALFSLSSNMIPYLASNQGNRAMMAAKQIEQAISLKHRESPLVQVGADPGHTMESRMGQFSAVHATEDGKVVKVTPDYIKIKTKAGESQVLNTYNNFQLNRKSFIHHTAVVKEGDKVKQGQLLADSNFTKGGVLALGTNLRTAYLPFGGLNHDDGVVITDSAAEKLTSEHIHKKEYQIEDRSILSLVAFKSNYPNVLTASNASKLDSDGVIQKGAKVHMGDVLISALKKQDVNYNLALVGKKLADRPRDDSLTWTMEDEGLVQEVNKTSKYITVSIKTEERAKIGDKLTGRHGNKGVITHILPDSLAPKNAQGEHVEVMLNPVGVVSRINIGQIYESAAAKVADKIKKPVVIKNFTGEDYLKSTKALLKKNGVDDKEELFDAGTGKSLGMVHVGIPHIMKLVKQTTANYSVRQGGPGHPYDDNMQPTKGGEEGSKALDQLTMYCLLSHGARANLREMATTKSESNDEFWKALKSGQQLPPPKTSFAYNKFTNYLKGAGIDIQKNGTKMTLAPLTDAKVLELSSGKIEKPIFYNAKDMTPKKGGLFDPVILGGFRGEKWGHMELHEAIVNPIFETAARKVTGLGTKFDDIVAGKLHLDSKGAFNTDGKGVTGGAALEKILKNINVEGELGAIRKKLPYLKATALDEANKKARYLMALKETGLQPHEAYLRKQLPIIPSIYRPVYPGQDGVVRNSDLNFIYQNVGILNSMMKLPVMEHLSEAAKSDIRKDLYTHVQGLSGLTDLTIKGRAREGFISELRGGAGGQPKEGFFISKLVSKRQDFVGRGTIIPDPNLGVDEVAIPEEMAWKLFEPFIIREMKNHGFTPIAAKEEIDKKSAIAQKTLEMVMRNRHVLLNRAPSLHKFSIMAFRPKITSGRSVKIPPLVNKGFNGDFDGDTMTVHVPITDAANREAEKMLPSHNLYQPGTGDLMLIPSQESQMGLYYLSQTPAGRKTLNDMLPSKFKVASLLDKGATKKMLGDISRTVKPDEFAAILKTLKDAGDKHSYDVGFTLGVNDLGGAETARNHVVKELELKLSQTRDPTEVSRLNDQYSKKLQTIMANQFGGKRNSLFDMVTSGAKGSASQLRSILTTPLLVTDAKGAIIPKVIHNSYSEGLTVPDYWVSMSGARRGMMDRSIQSQKPGAFSKDLMAAALDNVISGEDCGTKEGIYLKIDDRDAMDRFTAGDQAGVSHNTIVDSSTITRIKKTGARLIKVRSPLRCLRPKGTCARCYGLDEHGHPPAVGENVGVKSGQAIAEPLQQGIMNAFHTGGTAGGGGAGSVTGFARVQQLTNLPKIVVGAAPLAPKDGIISSIVKGLAGGFNVSVGDQVLHVPRGLPLKVKVGDSVHVGDPLSEGTIKPQDLVKLKGMHEAQEYIASELKNAYTGMGQNIHRKTFETIVRSLGNTTKILNNSRGTGFIPGDIAPYTVIEHHNKNLISTVPLEEAIGLKLHGAQEGYRQGHELGSKDIDIFKARGLKELLVAKEPIIHAPILKGMSALPLLRKDWLAALGYRYHKRGLSEGAGQGWSTDLESYHPIPAFAHGITFGQGKEGKY